MTAEEAFQELEQVLREALSLRATAIAIAAAKAAAKFDYQLNEALRAAMEEDRARNED